MNPINLKYLWSLLAMILFGSALQLAAQPQALVDDISIKKLSSVSSNPIRIDKHPLTNELYILNDRGDVYLINPENARQELVFSTSDHGFNKTFGLEIGATGNFYVVAAEQVNGNNIGKVAKGEPDGNGGYEWTLLAETEPYRQSGNRDHQFSAIIESIDGAYVYVNSGSRTDHGEEAENDGKREMPITSAILKIPVDSENLILENNADFLQSNGYLYADGIRNTFDLEYAPNGDLFGVENSDTRDNEEELNWLQEGKHYGFPWRIGTHNNPQQFDDFSPPASDNLLVQGINMESTFYNDPTFPEVPVDVSFTEPVLNYGPHADIIRDSVDGAIQDGSEISRAIGTFTPHSSPVALTFDTENQLGGAYTGGGFAMSYNASSQRKYEPFLDPGEDLMFLELTKDGDHYTTKITRLAQGFEGPIDAVLVANKMYILEYGGGNLWEVTFPDNNILGAEKTTSSISPLVQVYPNPIGQKLTISASFVGLEISGALLYDVNGKKMGVFSQTGADFTIPTADLSPGVYFIHVATSKGTAFKKVIKK